MEKMSKLKRAWHLKMNAKRYQRMVQMMEGMSVRDMEMDVDWIKSRIIEMMEVEDQMQDEIREWLVDRDGEQVKPQVEVTKNI